MMRLILALCCSSVAAEVVVTGNPHTRPSDAPRKLPAETTAFHKDAKQCLTQDFLSNDNVITWPKHNLQPDTIREVIPVRIQNPSGLPSHFHAPVYHFLQSPRIVKNQLPFKILLLKNVPPHITSVPIRAKEAKDSWYEGYRWNILLCGDLHMGWEFIAPNGDHFYGLIVAHGDPDQAVAQRIKEKSGVSSDVKIPSHEEDAAIMPIQLAPRDAEGWMLSALALMLRSNGKTEL